MPIIGPFHPQINGWLSSQVNLLGVHVRLCPAPLSAEGLRCNTRDLNTPSFNWLMAAAGDGIGHAPRLAVAAEDIRTVCDVVEVSGRFFRGKMLWGGGADIASIVADVNRWTTSGRS